MILIIASTKGYAQEYGDDFNGGWYEESELKPQNYEMGIGLQLLYGGGKNLRADYPQTSTTWVWNDFLDVTLVGFVPIGEARPMGVIAEAGLENLAYGNSEQNEVHVNYINLGASFLFRGAYAGFGYGINMGGIRVDPNGTEDDLAADVFNNILELKAGYQIQIGKKKVTSGGRFNLVAQISYALNGMNKTNKVWQDPTNQYRHRNYNYQPFEVKFGFNYLFDYKKNNMSY